MVRPTKHTKNTKEMKGRVAVGLSGGVDSAVAAALLLRAGFEVVGITMRIWKGGAAPAGQSNGRDGRHGCYGPGEEEDIAACERLAAFLRIDYRVIDLADEYERLVLDYFRREYRSGRTPNPCVVCNREMKFGFLLERARASGLEFESFATGHYARIVEKDGLRFLARARSAEKDQSYFLHTLDSDLLARLRFPLGELDKEEVRAEARLLGLEVADKAESQDFVTGGDYGSLFADLLPEPGDFVDTEGRVLGRHRGLPFYTIGQRRGLGLSTGPEALYVLRIEAAGNRIVLGHGAGLFSEGLEARPFRFQDTRMVAGLADTGLKALAKVRLGHQPCPVSVAAGQEGAVFLRFDRPERAIAPGQSVVLYDEGGIDLRAGIIERAVEATGD